jgi:RHS repeat-associated protein
MGMRTQVFKRRSAEHLGHDRADGRRQLISLFQQGTARAIGVSLLSLPALRHYDANVQRWPNIEPMGELGSDGINLYAFVRNRPTILVDPVGRESFDMFARDEPPHRDCVDVVAGLSRGPGQASASDPPRDSSTFGSFGDSLSSYVVKLCGDRCHFGGGRLGLRHRGRIHFR